MRPSSTTWTVTLQPLSSSRSSPSTDSTGRPSSSGSSRRTRSIASGPESPRPFLRRSAIFGLLQRSGAAGLADSQPLHQTVLSPLPLVLLDRAVVVFELELQQLAADPALVVELVLCLLRELLGHPRDAANGRQWQREQAGDQTHVQPPWVNSTNECGGSGPVYLKRSRPDWLSASRSSALSNSSS